MKNLKLKMTFLLVLLVSAFAFSQSLQPKPIQFDNVEGVFIDIDLMDLVTLKMIDRNVLKKEVVSLYSIIKNVKNQNEQLALKFDLSLMQTGKYKDLWSIAERQKDILFISLEKQKIITSNVKKKPLGTGFYTSEGASRSVWSPLLC